MTQPTPTLIADLEAAADVLRLGLSPNLDSTLGARLRAASQRLKREIEQAELLRDMVVNHVKQDNLAKVLARINGGNP